MRFISKDVRINREIRAREVRVIDQEAKQLGVLPIVEALRLATIAELDLVEVSSKTDPPVCRIMDYGKFKYQQSKKAHDAKKKQTVIHLKEVKMRPKTEEHDFQFKLRHIERFLKEGNKTKITVVFRGRELAHPDLGRNLLSRVTEGDAGGERLSSPQIRGKKSNHDSGPRSDSEARMNGKKFQSQF